MGTPAPAEPFTLRRLPLAARLVLTVFLLTVGLGYFSALVQLHFQHASKGEPMPTPDDVVEHFSGVPHYWTGQPDAGPPPKPMSQLERLVTGPGKKKGEVLAWNGTGSMGPAFFQECPEYRRAIKKRPVEEVDAEREGERMGFAAWVNAEEPARKAAYDGDKFPLPDALKGKPLTEDFLEDGSLKIRSLIGERCVRCHADGQNGADLDTYDNLARFTTLPKVDNEGRAKSPRQVSVEKLTQSTHVHALGFSMLWALTGLVFAFTSYPGWLRAVVAPWVLLAQLADLSCWWLARLDGVGPYFALAIIGTGALVGTGLLLQIVLSLFNMYGPAGKGVLVVLFLAAAGGFGVLAKTVLLPELKAEREAVAAAKAGEKP